jgi:hypothetical protein
MGQEPLARSLLLAPRPLPLNESLLCARAPVRKPRARVFVCRVEAQEPGEVSGRRLADVAVSGVELERRHPIHGRKKRKSVCYVGHSRPCTWLYLSKIKSPVRKPIVTRPKILAELCL